MEAIRPAGPEDKRPDVRGQAPIALVRGVGDAQQDRPLSPIAQGKSLPPGAAAPAERKAEPVYSAQALETAVAQLRDHLQSIERSLNFTVDEESGRTVIKVMDMETNEVIRQIPAEEALRILRHITTTENGGKGSQGFFVSERA